MLNSTLRALPAAPPCSRMRRSPALPADHHSRTEERELSLSCEADVHQLYQEFQPLVRKLVRQFGKTPELSQDLEGEIYCRFRRLVSGYDPSRGVPLRPYLVRMIQQTTFNYIRDHWRRENRTVSIESETSGVAEVPAAEGGADWLQRMVGREVLEALPAAIAKLPNRQRTVVVWRFYDELSFDEIAARLEIRPATARSLLRHGMEALRRQMRQTGHLD